MIVRVGCLTESKRQIRVEHPLIFEFSLQNISYSTLLFLLFLLFVLVPQRDVGIVGDAGAPESSDADFYAAADFMVGATVNVYGRQFFIYAVDEFTKEYLKRRMVCGRGDKTGVFLCCFSSFDSTCGLKCLVVSCYSDL